MILSLDDGFLLFCAHVFDLCDWNLIPEPILYKFLFFLNILQYVAMSVQMEYVRSVCKPKDGKLHGIGHSMGGMLLYAMLSQCGKMVCIS